MTTLIALCLFSDPAIELQPRLASIEAIVGELAQKSGRPYRMKKELANEFLFVSMKPRSSDEWARLIAKAASAEWSQEGETLYLGRSASLRRRLAKEEAETLRAAFERSERLKYPDEELQPAQLTQQLKKIGSIIQQSINDFTPLSVLDRQLLLELITLSDPFMRFTARLVKAVGVARLSSIPVGSNVRFANVNRPYTIVVPGLTELYAKYLRELKMTETARLSLPAERRELVEQFSFSDRTESERVSDVTTICVEACRNQADEVNLIVQLSDPLGRLVTGRYISLSGTDFGLPIRLPGEKLWLGKPAPAIPIIDGVYDHERQVALKEHWNLVVSEPLKINLEPAFKKIVTESKIEVITPVPDSVLSPYVNLAESKGVQLDDFLTILRQNVRFASENNGWVGVAYFAGSNAETKVDRLAFTKLLWSMGHAPFGWSDLVRYVSKQPPSLFLGPSSGETSLEFLLLRANDPIPASEETSALFGGADCWLVCLADRLTNGEWQQLRAGKELTSRTMSSSPREAAQRYLNSFGALGRLRSFTPDVEIMSPEGTLASIDDWSLSVSLIEEEPYLFWKELRQRTCESAYEIGKRTAGEEKDGASAEDPESGQKILYSPGFGRRYGFRFTFETGAFTHAFIHLTSVDARTKPVSASKLQGPAGEAFREGYREIAGRDPR